jgi:DNA-binding CsgD family transcriptional regulator
MLSDSLSFALVGAALLHRHAVPAIIVDTDGRISHHNDAALRLLKTRSCVGERRGRLFLRSTAAQSAFTEILLSAQRAPVASQWPTRGLRIARAGQRRDWLLAVSLLDFMSPAAPNVSYAVVQIIGRVWPRELSQQLLADLFVFTRAEVAVVTELGRGRNVAAAALQLGLSPETVRTHLKRIFRKCQVGSRPELLTLLSTLSVFGSG